MFHPMLKNSIESCIRSVSVVSWWFPFPIATRTLRVTLGIGNPVVQETSGRPLGRYRVETTMYEKCVFCFVLSITANARQHVMFLFPPRLQVSRVFVFLRSATAV